MALFFSILVTTTAPISAVLATWVPPQGCRSTPSISSTRTRPRPRGGCTLMLRTRPRVGVEFGLADPAVAHRVRLGHQAGDAGGERSLSSGSAMWKSSRA
jgi:hypothetical protein